MPRGVPKKPREAKEKKEKKPEKKPPTPRNKAVGVSRKAPRRTYTLEESTIWRNRSLKCTSFEVARAEYALAQSRSSGGNGGGNGGIYKITWIDISRRRRNVPLKSNNKGVYHACDAVGPILEALSRMFASGTDDVFDVFAEHTVKAKKRRVGMGVATLSTFSPIGRDYSSMKPEAAPKPAQWSCRGCGNTNRGKLVRTVEGYACSVCGAVCGAVSIATTRERLGAAMADDKTVHADAAFQPKLDRYDAPPASAAEARRARIQQAKLSSVNSSRKMGTWQAQSVLESAAAAEAREVAIATGIELHPREQIKQRAVLTALEAVFKILQPVHKSIARAIRIATDNCFVSSIQHANQCQCGGACELRLADRHSTSIAHACFEHCIEEMNAKVDQGDLTVEGVEAVRIREVRDRMKSSTLFYSRISASQLSTSRQAISVILKPGFDATISCTPLVPDDAMDVDDMDASAMPPPPPRLPKSGRGVTPFRRSLSASSSEGSISPTMVPCRVGEVREAIVNVFLAHRAELPLGVRETAIARLESRDFLNRCNAEPALATLDDPQLAFCLLNAVASTSKLDHSFASTSRLNAGIANQLDLGLITAHDAVAVLTQIVMEQQGDSVQDDKNADDDDNLFA